MSDLMDYHGMWDDRYSKEIIELIKNALRNPDGLIHVDYGIKRDFDYPHVFDVYVKIIYVDGGDSDNE